jgi:hypothetical protein
MKKASRRSLDRRPSKHRKRKKKKWNGCFGNSNSVARFDDVASWCVWLAFAQVTIEANRDAGSVDWHYARSSDVLNRISALLLAYAVSGHENYARLFQDKGARLVVALVSDITAEPETIKVPENGSPFAAENLKVHRVPILWSATNNCGEKVINLTDERWKIARRKFGLPGKKYVKGPYLIVAAVDNVTGLTLRARMWPIWLEPHTDTFAVVRSGYERLAAQSVHSIGGMCFLPTHKEQLGLLQKAFGTRWTGNLNAYAFLPDLLLFPKQGGTITLLEIFGLTSFKKYAEGKRIKEIAAVKGSSANTYLFLSIETRELKRGDPEVVIQKILHAWLHDEDRKLWRRKK